MYTPYCTQVRAYHPTLFIIEIVPLEKVLVVYTGVGTGFISALSLRLSREEMNLSFPICSSERCFDSRNSLRVMFLSSCGSSLPQELGWRQKKSHHHRSVSASLDGSISTQKCHYDSIILSTFTGGRISFVILTNSICSTLFAIIFFILGKLGKLKI